MSSPAPARPRVVDLAAQPYVFVHDTVSMAEIPRIADRLPGIIMELAAQGVGIGGAPFFRYLLIDMPGRLDMEAGVPVDSTEGLRLAGDLRAGLLPAGRYATWQHHGRPAGLEAATADLLAWAEREGLRWDSEPTPEGERWGCRLERYLTDPRIQPDMAQWETELSFRLAD
jgi:GyrI-like small molecule binding domain